MFRCDTTLFVSKKLPVHLIAECDNDLSISYLNNMKCQDVSSVMDYFDCQVCFQFDFFHCYYFLWKSGRSWFGDFFFRKLLHCLFVSGVFFNVETVYARVAEKCCMLFSL